MKCMQCQRNKNICSSGNGSVCKGVINDMMTKQQEAFQKKSSFEKVEVALKIMIEIHTKLVNGSPIDHGTVNALLLGGMVNIS